MEVKALMTFVHGSLLMARGEAREIPASVAAELSRAGLVAEVKAAPEPDNKAKPAAKNKAKK